ncbi:aldehyde dehydrogenase family protein [Roseinatronobacter bogoriensis]|uniref:Aldehyde dehydrogenase n=1 Tax=Roseinatronobacter bogoriensis subsp. barguzinensis TaxID=441209 RepID=A0A2K8KDH5_9RHOB|nr:MULTISPECIES: aldehyde dehydrogenase family protein [Rhodobaca]ATX64808.1 aldehyde dehydrogenase [Rhodobaca barguzinensis]MBB4208596.1 sulfoacetaldehyde dehydrogenase [Rhodobaca bogoriensis DSM 18756]TDW38135.1 sulfoacetaldehyde dehydrogenase [Rhodobaca barguzinensis]TDY69694.1 sulfoacetaldehyde dehydrogenase [Rhodobaca bogoriensis DSM 18756]
MARELTEAETATVDAMIARARAAMDEIKDYDQAQVDRLAQALGWACGNETTFLRIAQMGVDESGIGDRAGRAGKRFKILGVLRDALRGKSVGVIEQDPEKGLTKIAKPAGVIASLIPTTNPELTPPVTGIYAIKCKDAVIFSPHPRARQTTFEMVRVMRETLAKLGAPRDLFQCVEHPSIPMTEYLMSQADLTMATGGKPMVQAAYSSGKPAYGVGAGNATMVIDEDADITEAALNSRLSKTSDFGSGCSADGNLVIHAKIYDAMRAALIAEGGYLCSPEEKALLAKALWKDDGSRRVETVAIAAQAIAEFAGFIIPDDRKFIMVEQDEIGREHKFSGEKLCVVMALYRAADFDDALAKVRAIYEVGGKGHSCGIYSFNEDHILRHAMNAPVSRVMVRQPQSKANAGSFSNGMPMTSSLGCGIWGGNITNENVSLKHYMNVTWVARPIPEDRPSDAELFGEFYNTEVM